MRKITLKRTVLIMLLSCFMAPAYGEKAVTPSDVFTTVQKLDLLTERIRHHMGAPKALPLKLAIENAQPHDVFFQAQTLFQKTNRLLFQVTRTRLPVPEIPQQVYLPADVLELVQRSENNLSLILMELGLPSSASITADDRADASPSDVFLAIQGLNRQVNRLLDTPFAPSDVYMQVTLAIGYGAKQLARFPKARRIPDPSEAASGRVPSDVYFRLLEGLERLTKIYELHGLASLRVDAETLQKEEITPSDVYDIASLLVARLDFLHKHNKIQMLPRKPFYPGKVYPTDVYRQAGILLSQLDSLIEMHNRNSAN